ncbi:MAG: hypothetical protein HEP71_32490 [Roseivirga sp.]|nr:hypothetical protein [Roseivirga sp.]
MNVFKALYCNQYYELKPKGKEAAARTNGTRLLAVGIALNIITVVIFMMVFSEDFTDAFGDLITDIFGRRSGRSVGKVVALIPFLISLPLIRYTLGKESNYNALIAEFESLSAEEQKKVSNKGLYYFIISMGAICLGVVLIFIFLA